MEFNRLLMSPCFLVINTEIGPYETGSMFTYKFTHHTKQLLHVTQEGRGWVEEYWILIIYIKTITNVNLFFMVKCTDNSLDVKWILVAFCHEGQVNIRYYLTIYCKNITGISYHSNVSQCLDFSYFYTAPLDYALPWCWFDPDRFLPD